jgi:hypothetical protein
VFSAAMARPAVIDSAAPSVSAFKTENLGRLVIVVILAVTRDSVWTVERYDGFDFNECDLGHISRTGSFGLWHAEIAGLLRSLEHPMLCPVKFRQIRRGRVAPRQRRCANKESARCISKSSIAWQSRVSEVI